LVIFFVLPERTGRENSSARKSIRSIFPEGRGGIQVVVFSMHTCEKSWTQEIKKDALSFLRTSSK
jgi:hypothetical protein